MNVIAHTIFIVIFNAKQTTVLLCTSLRNEYVNAKDECQRYSVNHSVFDQLPETFTMDDLRSLKRGFCNEPALRKIISRWCRDHWIEKIDRNHWRKLPQDVKM